MNNWREIKKARRGGISPRYVFFHGVLVGAGCLLLALWLTWYMFIPK